jgi:single-strand DNA-binding protein
MNKVILMGRLTRDAQTRYTEGTESMAISRFTLAVDRRTQRNQEGQSADFISCVAFGKTGQFFEKYGQQGTKSAIEGRIQTGSYTNREGQKVYTTDVVIETAEFAESKAAAGENQQRPQPTPDNGDGFMTIPDGIDDELPFT